MARRITQSAAMKRLRAEDWRWDRRDKAWEQRGADFEGGVVRITHRRHTGGRGEVFRVIYYTRDPRKHWQGEDFRTLKDAVAYANEHLEEAIAADEADLAGLPREAREREIRRRASKPRTTDIYPENMNHGWDEPLAGGTDVMRRVQNELRREQGLPERPASPKVAAGDKPRAPGLRNPYYEAGDGIIGLSWAVRDDPQLRADRKLVALVKKLEAAHDAVHAHINANYIWD